MNDANTLDVAEYVLLRDCMRELGFDYIVVDPRSLPQSRDFPYVINDVAWARQHGYGTDIELAQNQARQHDPNDKYMQSLSQSVGLRSW